MSDDGTGMGIRIPSLLISKADGKIIKDFLYKYGGTQYMKKKDRDNGDRQDDDEEKEEEDEPTDKDNHNRAMIEQASLLVTFEMPRPDNRVEYDIWYTSIDDRALDFISDFEKLDEMLGEHVLMTPHFVSTSCTDCHQTFKETECYGNGKYCAIMHDKIKLEGKEILHEDLRQKCIYELTYESNRKTFWEYIKTVHKKCSGYINED